MRYGPRDVVVVPPSSEAKARMRSLSKDIAQVAGGPAIGAAGIAAVAK